MTTPNGHVGPRHLARCDNCQAPGQTYPVLRRRERWCSACIDRILMAAEVWDRWRALTE